MAVEAATSTVAPASDSRLEETMLIVRVYGNVVTSWHLVLDSSNTYH